MKKSEIKAKKLTKKQLKEINGGAGIDCVMECICMFPDGSSQIGVCTSKGDCCL